MGSPAYIQQNRYTSCTTHGASISPPPAPPSGGGIPPPPASGGGGPPPIGPSCPGGKRPLVIAASTADVALWPAMVAVPPHTTPGNSRLGYASTCPQAHPAKPSPDNGVCHQNPLWLLPKERVMAPHQGHRTDASSLPSLAQLVTPWNPPVDVSLPTVVSLALDETTLSTSPPRTHEVPHLHIQQKQTDSISIYIIYIWNSISKNKINQHIHTNTKHTSMVKHFP
jgi:hypothetical protein